MSVNPPRRAKRPIPPEILGSATDEDQLDGGEEFEGDEEVNSTRISKRTRTSKANTRAKSSAGGSGSGYMSRSQREHARRLNHSKIEKRRRVKINDTLDELRKLIPIGWKAKDPSHLPAGLGVAEVGVGEDDPNAREEAGKEDKGFKLDVLENTVDYVVFLQKRIMELEQAAGREGDAVSNAERFPTRDAGGNTYPVLDPEIDPVERVGLGPVTPISPFATPGSDFKDAETSGSATAAAPAQKGAFRSLKESGLADPVSGSGATPKSQNPRPSLPSISTLLNPLPPDEDDE